MFFELHNEKKIGYKLLSKPDLGLKKGSHQTHIGLFDGILEFLPNIDSINEDSIFIYNNQFEYIDAYFNRIRNLDGTYRSPKIKIGGRQCVSVVSTIRQCVKSYPYDTDWYLCWFGLKNSKIVFFLFNKDSNDYTNIINLGFDFSKKKGKIDASNPNFNVLVEYLEKKINEYGHNFLKELEIYSQVEVSPNKSQNKYDIERANENFRKIGREGESLIDEYFASLLKQGLISNYEWHNKEVESGYPYDFTVQDLYDCITYIDVKTTNFDFNQKIIFSKQEIKFISETKDNYSVYRVYKTEKSEYVLRICESSKIFLSNIDMNIKNFQSTLDAFDVDLENIKLAVPPNIDGFIFNEVIELKCS